ncbi:MAG: carbohydrate kinase family protein [Eubacteriales bacterium]|nr:carbohydrate kinase family protein [Eubacteriales bacterium]
MKTFDVITLGIAVMDIIAVPADHSIFKRDKTMIDEIAVVPGGDATNQSIILSKLGLGVSLCCRIGDDNLGRLLLSLLEPYSVDTSRVVVSSTSVTSTAISLVSASGDRNIICRRGNNLDFCFEDIDLGHMAKARALSVGSIFGIPKLEDNGLLEILKFARESGVMTFADMASDKKGLKFKGVAPFLPYIDYYMPSQAESSYLTGFSDCREAAKVFLDAGAENVAIKLGEGGVYFKGNGYSGLTNAFKITAKDTTGAGDAFCSGFICSILGGRNINDALEFASACGAFNSLYLGANTSPISVAAVNDFIRSTPKHQRIDL